MKTHMASSHISKTAAAHRGMLIFKQTLAVTM